MGVAIIGGAAVAAAVLTSDEEDGDISSGSCALPLDFTDSSDSGDCAETPAPEHLPGEKYWNPRSRNWEMDGKPYIYRVTYKDRRDGKVYTRDYTDVDNAWDACKGLEKTTFATNVTYDHIPPSED